MQFEQFVTKAFEDLQQGNSTDEVTADNKVAMSTMEYFHTIFPVMISMGYGGTAAAFCYLTILVIVICPPGCKPAMTTGFRLALAV